jgi:signal transduction histidine kinase
MSGAGRITIQTQFYDHNVCLVVEDTGPGMNKEVLDKIFVPFFTTKDVGQGTGLGLPVIHGIVTAHGGSINVESKVGCGSRFEIRLPVEEPQNMEENN